MSKNEIDVEELKRIYSEEGMTIKGMSKLLKIDERKIRKILKENGVPIKGSNVLNRKYNFNEKYFDTIDTKEKAYLLGFICADGWIGKNRCGTPNLLGLCLKEEDRDTVKFLKEQLEAEQPIVDKISHLNTKQVEINICSTYLGKSLGRMGIVPNKSLIINLKEVSKFIPKEFEHYLLLGYFDGDGGIASGLGQNGKTVQWSLNVTGTKETCEYFKEYFSSNGFFVKRHKDEKNNYTFMISGKNLVTRALDKLYSEDTSFCLQRKYKKYLTMKGVPLDSDV